MKAGKTVMMQDLGLCPCGSRISVNAEQGAIAHEPPVCETFMKLEPDEFLSYVRKARQSA
jgi:hypothetical protein